MGIDIKLVIGVSARERLSCDRHVDLIEALVNMEVFQPPFAVLAGTDIERVHGYRFGKDISSVPILDRWDDENAKWHYKIPDCQLLYLGDELSSSLAALQQGYSGSPVKWEAASLALEPLQLGAKEWDMSDYLNALPEPRIISWHESRTETITQGESFDEIGPFYDILKTGATKIYLGDPDRKGGPEGNYAVLLRSEFGKIIKSCWGSVSGGDWIAL